MADTSKTTMPDKILKFITAELLLMLSINSFYFTEHVTSIEKIRFSVWQYLLIRLKKMLFTHRTSRRQTKHVLVKTSFLEPAFLQGSANGKPDVVFLYQPIVGGTLGSDFNSNVHRRT